MGNIVDFNPDQKTDPNGHVPKPHFPAAAVREYLRENKKDALLRSRVPEMVAKYIARVAEISNTTPSGLTRMIMTDWTFNQGVICPPERAA